MFAELGDGAPSFTQHGTTVTPPRPTGAATAQTPFPKKSLLREPRPELRREGELGSLHPKSSPLGAFSHCPGHTLAYPPSPMPLTLVCWDSPQHFLFQMGPRHSGTVGTLMSVFPLIKRVFTDYPQATGMIPGGDASLQQVQGSRIVYTCPCSSATGAGEILNFFKCTYFFLGQ